MTLLSDTLSTVQYCPILMTRPAEMNALQNLSRTDKKQILPAFLIRKWANSKSIDKTTDKIGEGFEQLPWIGDLDQEHIASGNTLTQLVELSDPTNGFERWCKFAADQEWMIPCAQLTKPTELTAQVKMLLGLNRGLAVRFSYLQFGEIPKIISAIASCQPEDIIVFLDYGYVKKSNLLEVATCISHIDLISKVMPNAWIAVSATTFPEDFGSITEAPIDERHFFNAVRSKRPKQKLIYSDRGSARDSKPRGGGTVPPPRIDYPTFDRWYFRREPEDGYAKAAQGIKALIDWKNRPPVWGVQLIERTANGDPFGINSPVKATAARINIHLHNQIFYDNQSAATLDEEEPWVD